MFFGWRVQHHTRGHWLMFSFEKPFPQVTAREAVDQMWDTELRMHSYRDRVDIAHQSMRIVQHVNNDTYVFERRMAPNPHQQHSYRQGQQHTVVSTYLRFRLKTATGFAVGVTTLDASSTDSEEEEDSCSSTWATDVCFWTEFVVAPSPYGREYCIAKIAGRTNVEDVAHRHQAVADCIMGLLRWENVNIGPMFTFEA